MKLKRENDSNKTLQEGMDEFFKHCKVKNLSEHTIRYYTNSMDLFTKFYNQENRLNDITKSTVDDFILYLRDNTNFNDISINTTLKAIRAICYYFMKLSYMKKFKIELIRAEKKIKNTYTDAELELLLKKPDLNQCHFGEYRTWTIENFLLGTACRASTVVNIKIKDLDFSNQLITLEKTKNRSQQIIPMSSTLGKIIEEYIEYRKAENSEDYLFCDIWGNQLTVKGLQSAIRIYNQNRGVMRTSVHAFRHTFAKKWILNNGDIFRLQKVLGHNSLDMVRNYVNMFTNDLQQDFDKFNPLEQMVNKNNKNHIKIKK